MNSIGSVPYCSKTDVEVSPGCSYAAVAPVGNGIVDTATESGCALEHLVKAQMLSKVELSGSNYVIPHPFKGGSVSLSVIPTTKENAVRVTNLPCKFVLRIEAKLDNASTIRPLASDHVISLVSLNSNINECGAGEENTLVSTLLIRY